MTADLILYSMTLLVCSPICSYPTRLGHFPEWFIVWIFRGRGRGVNSYGKLPDSGCLGSERLRSLPGREDLLQMQNASRR